LSKNYTFYYKNNINFKMIHVEKIYEISNFQINRFVKQFFIENMSNN
jgi:hypothetical protein